MISETNSMYVFVYMCVCVYMNVHIYLSVTLKENTADIDYYPHVQIELKRLFHNQQYM